MVAGSSPPTRPHEESWPSWPPWAENTWKYRGNICYYTVLVVRCCQNDLWSWDCLIKTCSSQQLLFIDFPCYFFRYQKCNTSWSPSASCSRPARAWLEEGRPSRYTRPGCGMKSTLRMLKSFDILDVCLYEYLGWFLRAKYVQRFFSLDTIDGYRCQSWITRASLDRWTPWGCGADRAYLEAHLKLWMLTWANPRSLSWFDPWHHRSGVCAETGSHTTWKIQVDPNHIRRCPEPSDLSRAGSHEVSANLYHLFLQTKEQSPYTRSKSPCRDDRLMCI